MSGITRQTRRSPGRQPVSEGSHDTEKFSNTCASEPDVETSALASPMKIKSNSDGFKGADWTSELSGFVGDETLSFAFDLVDVGMRHFIEVYKSADLRDDHVFSGSLRWLYAMYIYLHGDRFQKELADAIGTSDSSVSRWVKAQSVPAPRLRRRIILEASKLVSAARETARVRIWLPDSHDEALLADENAEPVY